MGKEILTYGDIEIEKKKKKKEKKKKPPLKSYFSRRCRY